MTPPKLKKLTPLQAAKEEHRSLVVSFNVLKNRLDKAESNVTEITLKYNKRTEEYNNVIRRLDETLGDKHRLNQRVDQLTKELEEITNKKLVPTVRFEDNKITITYEN